MEDQLFVLVLILAGAAVMVIVIAFAYLSERRRTEALAEIAGGLGFTFSPKDNEAFLRKFLSFHLFSRGRSKKITNLMRGTFSGVEVAIFDYRYVTRSGKSSHTWHQSVICFEVQACMFPTFSLCPENVWHKFESALGEQDIDFGDYPAFSSRYLLRGNDEGAIRALFTPRLLEFYGTVKGAFAEGSGHLLMFYRRSHRVKPELIRAFLEEGAGLLSLFCPAAPVSMSLIRY